MISRTHTLKLVINCGFALVLTIMGCTTETQDVVVPAYIRVMDMRNIISQQDPQNPSDALLLESSFRMDGHYYGDPGLDTVKSAPTQTVSGYGDFSLGRVGSRDILQSTDQYTGLLDYIGPDIEFNPEFVLYQPYRQGADPKGRNVCYPNFSHRVSLAPVINEIDYFKWARIAAGTHSIGFAKIEYRSKRIGGSNNSTLNRSGLFLEEPFIRDNPYYFQPGAIYSLLLVSEYTTDRDKVKLLYVREDENFVPDPSKAYIRFINAIPITNTVTDNATESLDIYVRQIDNAELAKLKQDTITYYDPRFLRTTSPEKRVVSNLQRFTNGVVPYVELNFSEYLSREDTTSNSLNKEGVPSFVFYAYRSGESQATGAVPLQRYQYIATNTEIKKNADDIPASLVTDASGIILPYIPILAKGANGYVPTINTIVLGTDKLNFNGTQNFIMGYSLEQTFVRQDFLDRFNRGN